LLLIVCRKFQHIRRNPLPTCRVDFAASPQFLILREHWQTHGYPSIDDDLAEAFQNIGKDVQANHCKVVHRLTDVLGNFQLHKYRQKNRGAREGASGGWRIYALYDKPNGILYPIIVYPKKEWVDADENFIIKHVRELLEILRPKQV